MKSKTTTKAYCCDLFSFIYPLVMKTGRTVFGSRSVTSVHPLMALMTFQRKEKLQSSKQ